MKVLIIRFSSLGDVVLATAVVETVSRTVPEAEIDFAVREEYADLFREDPRIRNLWVWKRGQGQIDFLRGPRQKHYDLVLDLHRVARSFRLYPFLRYSRLVGCDKRSLERRLYVRFGFEREGRLRPLLSAFLETVERAGLGSERHPPRLALGDPARREIQNLFDTIGIKSNDPLLAVSPGAKAGVRCWPAERFAEVGKRAVREIGARVLVIGSPAEAGLVQEVKEMIGEERAHPLADLQLSVLAALLSRVHLLLANDSGPAHVARAVGSPVGVLFGPTSSRFFPAYGPRDFILERELSCRPCGLRGERPCSRPNRECLDLITAEEVWEKVKPYLSPGMHPGYK